MHHGPRDKQRLGLENYNDVGANVATITSMDKNKLKKKKKPSITLPASGTKESSQLLHPHTTNRLFV